MFAKRENDDASERALVRFTFRLERVFAALGL